MSIQLHSAILSCQSNFILLTNNIFRFACPDLTSKGGYWAKALAERYSVEKSILHFYVNSAGEMYYGLNGVSKGLFLAGINTNLPMWVIVDIYGNSVGLEFLGIFLLLLLGIPIKITKILFFQ